MTPKPPLTNGLRLAGQMAEQLRWAEINESWAYMHALLNTLRTMGARIIRLPDNRFVNRHDYIIQFREEDSLPGTFK